MTETKNTHCAAQATREDLAKGMQEHYEKISAEAHHWMSGIPRAIATWRDLPKLVEEARAAGFREGVERAAHEAETWEWEGQVTIAGDQIAKAIRSLRDDE